MKNTYITIKGFEIICMFKKGQFNKRMYVISTEVSFISEQFGLYKLDLYKIYDFLPVIFFATDPPIFIDNQLWIKSLFN
ncbi:transposase [Legionella busanensis]|uniref:Transposase n=1 Tax=Legionella busanensis TaxID=190655 RepID=A0A378JV88_9GAMM|nr:transposase [Legionella busanensis]